MSGTSKVRKRHVAQIVLVPAAVTLPAGGTQQFAAWGVRNTGDSVAVAITYSATGGTITSAGLYTAGQTAGSYRVIARQTNGSLADTAAVYTTCSDCRISSADAEPFLASTLVSRNESCRAASVWTGTNRRKSGWRRSARSSRSTSFSRTV